MLKVVFPHVNEHIHVHIVQQHFYGNFKCHELKLLRCFMHRHTYVQLQQAVTLFFFRVTTEY